ncbi:MAG: polyprenyl synthetase family protein [Phycisphaerae bacterium]
MRAASDNRSADADRLPAAGSTGFSDWLEQRRLAVEAGLSTHFAALKTLGKPHTRLIDAVLYSVASGGKRVRPVLVLESCGVCGGDESAAMPAAVAVECIHTFSLIHDDLPAMDNDDLRRGVPTNHKVFGDALAILAGDWLVTHAFRAICGAHVSGETRVAMVDALAIGTEGMVVGQAADIEGETLATDAARVGFIHLHKTARLIEASCRLGALAAQADNDCVSALSEYGRHLGIAFQICDDVLDCTSSTAALGKTAGKDAGASKQTFPAAYGIEESRRRAREEVDAAIASLGRLGSAADRLREVAEFVIQRDR